MESEEIEQKPAGTAGRKRNRRSLWRITAMAIAVIVLAAICYAAPVFLSKAPSRAIIVVPENPTFAQLSDTLAKHLGDSYASKTVRGARLMGKAFSLRPGAYEIPAGASAFKGARILGRGRQYIVTLALNNLRTKRQIAEKIASQVGFSAGSLLKALDNAEALSCYGLTPANSQAIFIADNYEVFWSISPEKFVEKMGDAYNRFWNKERRAKADSLGLSPVEAATIASIADEESAKYDEKGRICRLYLNRLTKGMRLQADPTVKFAIGDFAIKRVTHAMTETESPYNTYRISGLPPGPIRITDPRTVDALLDSKPTDELYMCAKEDLSGYHNFTSSFSEHQANATRYQRKLNEMGL